MPARQEQATDALDVARLVELAANGNGEAWGCLVDQYAELISAIAEDFEIGESAAADVARVTRLRLLEQIQRHERPDRDALSYLPQRWQQLLHLLMADPPASLLPRYPASWAFFPGSLLSSADDLPPTYAQPTYAHGCGTKSLSRLT